MGAPRSPDRTATNRDLSDYSTVTLFSSVFPVPAVDGFLCRSPRCSAAERSSAIASAPPAVFRYPPADVKPSRKHAGLFRSCCTCFTFSTTHWNQTAIWSSSTAPTDKAVVCQQQQQSLLATH
ncbi:unnamed protein product [Merluccius merluccius]